MKYLWVAQGKSNMSLIDLLKVASSLSISLVPKLGSSVVAVVDVVKFCLGLRVGKMKFLENGVVLVNVFCSFDPNIKLIASQHI